MRIARRCPRAAQYASALRGPCRGLSARRAVLRGQRQGDARRSPCTPRRPPTDSGNRSAPSPRPLRSRWMPLRARLRTSPAPGKPFRALPEPNGSPPGGVERGRPLDALPIEQRIRMMLHLIVIAGEQGGAWFVVHASFDAHDGPSPPREGRGGWTRRFTHNRLRISCSTPPPFPPQ